MSFRRIIYLRKVFICIAVFAILYILVILNRNSQIDDRDRQNRLDIIAQFIKTHETKYSCKLPNLPVNSSEIMKFIKNEPLVDCSSVEPDWVFVEGSICKLSSVAVKRYISITCKFTDLIRVNDYVLEDGNTTTLTNKPYTLKRSDVVRVECKSQNNIKWQAILTGVREDPEIEKRTGWSKLSSEALRLNILMFGFDSLSRNTFIRKLPKSYKYLTEILGAHILQGYNIVGDGTPQALIPILTGKTELELPEARKRIPGAGTVDNFPFIWKDFSQFGYVTGFLEDTPYVGTFTYRLNGFKNPPTDHYMRPYYLASAPFWKHYPNLCYGSVPRHKIMMNHVKNFFKVYNNKPKFIFGFHGELSHDSYNLIGVADDDFLEFLKELDNKNYLKDTILIVMADHGHRFTEIRNTVQGKQEERLPFFSFTFPPSFKVQYKEAYENFLNNKNLLTTPFDIYSTLKDVLILGDTKNYANLKERSLSLFSKIHEKRSCSDAYIEPHWCACLDWHEIAADSVIIPRLTATLLDTLNAYTNSHRHLCDLLYLKKIVWVTQLSPNDNLLRFKKNADIDGFVADLTANMVIENNLYQIKAILQPGNSIFEASITHFLKNNTFDLKISDISRVNMYGRQARCIENDFPHLRKYCHCKDDI